MERVFHRDHGIGTVSHEVGSMCWGDVRWFVRFDNGRGGVYDKVGELLIIDPKYKVYYWGTA